MKPTDKMTDAQDLPVGSFSHAGTNVNTVMVAVRNPAPAEQRIAA